MNIQIDALAFTQNTLTLKKARAGYTQLYLFEVEI